MNNIIIGQYEFNGPHTNDELQDEPGIYAVLHDSNGNFELIDLEESDNMRKRWESMYWCYDPSNYPGAVSVATFPTPGLSSLERKRITGEIIKEFEIPEELAS